MMGFTVKDMGNEEFFRSLEEGSRITMRLEGRMAGFKLEQPSSDIAVITIEYGVAGMTHVEVDVTQEGGENG